MKYKYPNEIEDSDREKEMRKRPTHLCADGTLFYKKYSYV